MQRRYVAMGRVKAGLDAALFHGGVSKLDVPSVKNMHSMFRGAKCFDDLCGWNVLSVTSVYGTFNGAEAFHGDISKWDVSRVMSMSEMLRGTR